MSKNKNKKIIKTRDVFFEDMISRKSGRHESTKKSRNRKLRKKARLLIRKGKYDDIGRALSRFNVVPISSRSNERISSNPLEDI